MLRFIAPLLVFVGLVVVFYIGLGKDPQILPSALLDKPAPAFNLPQLHKADMQFANEEMKGKVWLLNVWASWCGACRSEHPLFMEIARKGEVPMIGLNYKDKPNDAMTWLRQLGDPYMLSVSDMAGNVGIDYGVYGVPETFLIDKEGVIRYKHVGPVSRQDWETILKPKIKELEG
ncbi:MAG: DsbE family thiol:disulfide interchange protein [Gammaproteobacteria bacterium]|nr:DsbE family thiol:disulfide interchange protein [Gammaproteobacteria bacterium]